MTVPRDGSKYNMDSAPPYQVTFTQSASGKLLSGTKRRVTFGIGFADPNALSSGATGPDARGEEHEIKLVWSVASGKRFITMDGEEVHFSHGKSMEQKFETSWSLGKGNHTLKLVAHSANPLFFPVGFEPFDLFLDGLSFWRMPRIYELGIKKPNGRAPDMHAVQSPSFKRSTETDFALPPSVPESYALAESSKRSIYSPTGVTDVAALEPPKDDALAVVDLMDAGTPTALPPHEGFAEPANQPLFALEPDMSGPPMHQQPPPGAMIPQSFHHHHQALVPSPPPAHNHMVYQQPQQDTMAPNAYQQHSAPPGTPVGNSPPVHHYQQSQEAMVPANGYQQPFYPPTPPTYQQSGPPHYAQQPTQTHFATPPPHQSYAAPVHSVTPSPSHQAPEQDMVAAAPFPLSMDPLSLEDLNDHQADTSCPLEKAVSSLVNLQDLNETFKSPQDRKFAEKKQTQEPYRSKPLPPSAASWKLGLQPKLSEIQQTTPKGAPEKEVMRAHAFDPAAAQAGMMVAYGSTPSYYHQPQY